MASKVVAENDDLRSDKERLLGVVRRHKAAGLTEAMAAHRERLRKRKMTEKEVGGWVGGWPMEGTDPRRGPHAREDGAP